MSTSTPKHIFTDPPTSSMMPIQENDLELLKEIPEEGKNADDLQVCLCFFAQ